MGKAHSRSTDGSPLQAWRLDGVHDREGNAWHSRDAYFGEVVEAFLLQHRNHELRFVPEGVDELIETWASGVEPVEAADLLRQQSGVEVDADVELREWTKRLSRTGHERLDPTPMVSPLGLADSSLLHYVRTSDTAVVRIRAWNDRILIATFHDVLGLRDVVAGDFSGAVEGDERSGSFLRQTLQGGLSGPALRDAYRVYSFLNVDGEPSLEVVAARYEIRLEEA
jgi:hypothetical protein